MAAGGMSGKDLGALVGQIGADIREWEKAMGQIQKDLDKMEKEGEKATKSLAKSLDKAGKKMQQMGKQMTMRVTAPIVALAGASVKAFGDFDAAMTQSLAIMGDVSDTLQNEMSMAAREVAKTTTLSAKQAADSYFFLASAGLDAEQSLATLPQVAAFAQAGMFDMATATDLATDAQSALGLTVDDAADNLANMTRVTDVLVKANTLANATVEQFSTALTREAGSALKSFNKDIEEGVAVLAAFADQGIKGERAGAGLGRVIRLMVKAANNNQEAMARLGIEVFDAEGKMNNLADIVEDLEVAFSDMSDQERTASLEAIGFTARVQQMILPLLGTSDAIREYEAGLRQAGGTTQEIADNQLKAFNVQLGLLWDNIKDVGIIIGQDLEGALRGFVSTATDAVQAFQEMHSTTRLALLSLAGLLALGGPVLIGLGTLARSISALITIAPQAAAAMKALTAAMIAHPYFAVAAALGAIASAAWLAHQNIEAFHDSIDETLNTASDWQAVNDQITAVSERLEDIEDGAAIAGVSPETNDEYAVLQERLEKLIDLRDHLAFEESIFPQAKQTLEDALALTDTINMLQGGLAAMEKIVNQTNIARPFIEAQEPMHDIIPALDQVEQKMTELSEQDILSDFGNLNLGEKIAPPGSMAALQERLTQLREQLRFAIDPERVAMLNNQINITQAELDELTGQASSTSTAMIGVFSTLDNIFQQAVIHGEKLGSILANIAKQLASKALINGLAMLVSGGSFGLGKLLFGSVGSIVGDALIRDDGSIVQFHPNDDILAMKDFSQLAPAPAAAAPAETRGIEEAIRRGMERAVVIARMDASQAQQELDKHNAYQNRLGN